jgi:hypothetical protein
MLQRAIRRTPRAEAGQTLALIALLMPVLLGFLGLGLDFGRLAAQQRTLQNIADAAALAGGADLSLYYQQACTDAGTLLTRNSNPATSTCQVSTTTYTNDTITVTLTQSLPMYFMPVLGVASKTLTATAAATSASITACSSSNTNSAVCAPYAAWRPGAACTGAYTDFEPGQLVLIRSSQSSGWVNGTAGTVGTGAGGCSSAWTVSANDFKGFLRPYGSSTWSTGTDTITRGGNACGQEPVADIQAAFTSGQNLIIPVLDHGTAGQGSGNPSVHVSYFVTVNLTFTYPYSNQVQAVSFNPAPTGNKFSLSYGGSSTPQIAYQASAATVQSALEALPTIGAGNVAVTLNPDFSYTVTFQGAFATSTNIGLLTTGDTKTIITTTYTSSDTTRYGTASALNDYQCPQTWYAKVVSMSGSVTSTCAGTGTCGACNGTAYDCRVTLVQ